MILYSQTNQKLCIGIPEVHYSVWSLGGTVALLWCYGVDVETAE